MNVVDFPPERRDHLSVDAGVTTIIHVLDIIAEMSLNEINVAEVLRSEKGLNTIRTRVHLILNILDARRHTVARPWE